MSSTCTFFSLSIGQQISEHEGSAQIQNYYTLLVVEFCHLLIILIQGINDSMC